MVETVTEYRFTTQTGQKMSCIVTHDANSSMVERRYFDTNGAELSEHYYAANDEFYLGELETAANMRGVDKMHKANRQLYNFLKARLQNAN